MFSMGMRHKLDSADCSPGPKYLMHPRITRLGHDGTPAFSIYKRRKEPRLVQTPGPGQKDTCAHISCTTIKPKACEIVFPGVIIFGHKLLCSLFSLLLDICLGVTGAYCPERADRLSFHSAPACSLSGRHRESNNNQTPSNFWCLFKIRLKKS